jgi:hypothetical protein
LNQHFLCSGAAELLRHSPETRQFLALLQKYVPFLLILLAKCIYDHRLGKLVLLSDKMDKKQDKN